MTPEYREERRDSIPRRVHHDDAPYSVEQEWIDRSVRC
jgi:hypothetical protein